MDSIAALLDQASTLPVNSTKRKSLEKRALQESGTTNFNQCAALVEAVVIHAALENGASGDEDTAEALFAQAQTISQALRQLHELVQTIS